MWTIYEHYKLK